jgi:hypothetical protein
MRRRGIPIALAGAFALAIYLVPVGTAFGSSAAGKLALDEPVCSSSLSLCADPGGSVDGYYVSHDEPSLAAATGPTPVPLGFSDTLVTEHRRR